MADSDTVMARFDTPDIDDLPEDLQARIAEETDRAGFTPNIFPAMAYRPSHFRAFFAYHDALVEETALEREEVEMIIVAVSGVNDCLYCIVAHGALLRIYADAPKLAEQVAANHRTAEINETHKAMLDFAVKLTESPARIEDEDLERLPSSTSRTASHSSPTSARTTSSTIWAADAASVLTARSHVASAGRTVSAPHSGQLRSSTVAARCANSVPQSSQRNL